MEVALLLVLEKTISLICRFHIACPPPQGTQRGRGEGSGLGVGQTSVVALPPNSCMAPASPSVRLGLSLFLCKPGQMTRPSQGCWETSRRSGW